MVPAKILLLFVLVAAVACEPCIGRSKVKTRKRCRSGTDVAIKGGIKGFCGFLFKGLKSHCKFNKRVYDDIIKLDTPSDFDGSLGFLLKLGLGCGSAVELVFPGLGDLLSRWIGVVLRLLICNLGLFGKRGFCSSKYYDDYYGISCRDTDSVDALLKRFSCLSARDDFDGIVKKHSKGKGFDSFTGNKKIVITLCRDIIVIIEKKKTCSKSDLTILFDRVFAMTGTVGNGYSKDLGNGFTDTAVDSVDKYLVDNGCPSLKDRKKNLEKQICDSNNDDDNNDDNPWGDLSDDGSGNDGDDSEFYDDGKKDCGGKKDDGGKKDCNGKTDGGKGDGGKKCDDKNNGGNGNSGVDDCCGTVNIPLGGYLQIFVTPIMKGKGRCRISKQILNELVSVQSPENFSDVATLIFNMSYLVSSVCDTLVSGLGDLLRRIFLYISRAALCINGKGCDGFCGRDFVKIYEIEGDGSSCDDLITVYKLKGARDQVMAIIKKHTKGKSVKSCVKGSQRNVLSGCLRIADLVDNYNDDSYSSFYIELTKMMGIVANSFDDKHELGNQITRGMSSVCDKYVQERGYQCIKDNEEDISTTICTNETTWKQCVTTTTIVTIVTVEETECTQTQTQVQTKQTN